MIPYQRIRGYFTYVTGVTAVTHWRDYSTTVVYPLCDVSMSLMLMTMAVNGHLCLRHCSADHNPALYHRPHKGPHAPPQPRNRQQQPDQSPQLICLYLHFCLAAENSDSARNCNRSTAATANASMPRSYLKREGEKQKDELEEDDDVSKGGGREEGRARGARGRRERGTQIGRRTA